MQTGRAENPVRLLSGPTHRLAFSGTNNLTGSPRIVHGRAAEECLSVVGTATPTLSSSAERGHQPPTGCGVSPGRGSPEHAGFPNPRLLRERAAPTRSYSRIPLHMQLRSQAHAVSPGSCVEYTFRGYAKSLRTGMRHPGTTSEPSISSASVRVSTSAGLRWTFTTRLDGSTTITIRLPARSHSATLLSTSA